MYMYQFLIGCIAGVYIGTYYDCKPTINKITEFIIENTPTKK